MNSLKDLLAQKEALEAEIAQAIKSQKKEAIAQVKELIAEYSLTVSDVFGSEKKSKSAAKSPVAAKYRDPVSGQTWTGRGRAPKWMDGQDRGKFAI